jgi:hypothetical protein
MLEFITPKKALEDAVKLACLSTESVENLITGHCLFDFGDQTLKILATDNKNRLSRSIINIPSNPNTDGLGIKFTADPRKILKLIKTTEADTLKFGFNKENMTLQIFSSDNEGAFVSFPSFDPASYAPIDDNFEKAFELKNINAGVFLGGLQFIKGFLLDKHQKFSNMFINKGVMYGTNGNNKIGAFSSPDLENLDELVFPLSTFPAILNLITNLELQDIILSSSSNHIFISSPKKDFIFGFTKVQLKMPKMPININEPEADGWKINRSSMLKKLSRLHLTGDAKLGVRFIIDNDDKIQLSTVIDRPSKDIMECKRIKGTSSVNCITEVRLMETTLNQFGGDDIDLYISKKINIFSKANLEVSEGENKVLKPFVSAAAVALSLEE